MSEGDQVVYRIAVAFFAVLTIIMSWGDGRGRGYQQAIESHCFSETQEQKP